MPDREEKMYKNGTSYFIPSLHFHLTEENFLPERRILYLRELEMDSGMRPCSRALSVFPQS